MGGTTIETEPWLEATADSAAVFGGPDGSAAIAPGINHPIVLHNIGSGEVATGNSPINVMVAYVVLPTKL